MSGMGRSRVLAVRAYDPVMGAIAPIGLAASSGTALVVDVGGRPHHGGRSLADVISDGPRLDELSPGRSGVARIAGGPVATSEIAEAVGQLASRWPAVVVSIQDGDWPGPTVPVHVLYQGLLQTWERGASVWQPMSVGARPPGPGPLLPAIRPRLVRQLLMGRMPPPNRWVRAWRQVWEMSWA